MEVLKKTLLGFSMITLMVSFVQGSQKEEIIAKAFADSYLYESKGQYDMAIKALKAVYDENGYEINLRLGWLHYQNGLFSESLTYYRKAIQLMPSAIEPRFGFVLPAAALGQWAMVEKEYQEILSLDPKNTPANYRLGLIYFGRKDYRKAEKHFSVVVNLYPFDYDSSIMLAWASYYTGKTREAKVLFQKCLWMRPNDSSALEGLRLMK